MCNYMLAFLHNYPNAHSVLIGAGRQRGRRKRGRQTINLPFSDMV